jgi:hypothetical protein
VEWLREEKKLKGKQLMVEKYLFVGEFELEKLEVLKTYSAMEKRMMKYPLK